MKTIYYLFIAVFIFSCKEKITTINNISNKSQLSDKKSKSKNDTLWIDYRANKKKLDILTLLPDSCFTSWGWSKKDRELLLNEIRDKGYLVDTDSIMSIKMIKDNYFRYQVIDGSWEFAIYKIKDDNYMVVTNDMVGNGNSINLYEYQNKSLKSITNREGYFPNPLDDLRHNINDANCNAKLADENENAIFRYDFTKINEIEINNAWGFTKKEYSNCLKGNTLRYKFDPKSKKFKLQEIIWHNKDY